MCDLCDGPAPTDEDAEQPWQESLRSVLSGQRESLWSWLRHNALLRVDSPVRTVPPVSGMAPLMAVLAHDALICAAAAREKQADGIRQT